jgi:hypothetical protein
MDECKSVATNVVANQRAASAFFSQMRAIRWLWSIVSLPQLIVGNFSIVDHHGHWIASQLALLAQLQDAHMDLFTDQQTLKIKKNRAKSNRILKHDLSILLFFFTTHCTRSSYSVEATAAAH